MWCHHTRLTSELLCYFGFNLRHRNSSITLYLRTKRELGVTVAVIHAWLKYYYYYYTSLYINYTVICTFYLSTHKLQAQKWTLELKCRCVCPKSIFGVRYFRHLYACKLWVMTLHIVLFQQPYTAFLQNLLLLANDLCLVFFDCVFFLQKKMRMRLKTTLLMRMMTKMVVFFFVSLKGKTSQNEWHFQRFTVT